MTLVYAGETEGRNASEFNELGKDAISAIRTFGSGGFSLGVTGVDQLGDEGEEVDVLLLYPTPQLLVARSIVEKWDKSGFDDFLPHVTIGPAGSAYSQFASTNTDDYSYTERRRNTMPTSIYFDRLAVCWGNDKMIFALSGLDY